MSKDLSIYLDHIRDEVEFLMNSSQEITRGEFEEDQILKRAVVRSLEVIGEATKRLPADFREQHDRIPWRSMAGMRDVLIHDYFGIDYDIVWDVLVNRVPELNEQLTELN